jgi:hypothetical protein
MALTTRIAVNTLLNQTGSNDLGSPKFDVDVDNILNMASGTSSGQADLAFADQRTLSASATEDIDLAGTLIDGLGNTLTFVKVKAILIKAATGNTNNVEVTPAAANGFVGPFADVSDQIDIAPNGIMLVTAPNDGWAVTAGTGDLLTITNSAGGTSVTYDIIIVGTSA